MRKTPSGLTVGHLVPNYLPVTENWIHTQMTAAPGVSPLVLNRGVCSNQDQFPVAHQVCLQDLSATACRGEADAWERRGVSNLFV